MARIAVAFGYSLSNSGPITVTQGGSGSNTITATLTASSSQSASFSASGLPSGATASFNPTACTPTCSTQLTISTTSSTPTGTSPITVTGSWLSKTTSFNLVVNPVGAPPITSPAPGSTLTSSTVTFTGGHTAADLQHWLYVGTSSGAANLFNQDLGTGHSASVAGLPNSGTIYVTYWTRFASGWQFTNQPYTMSVVPTFGYALTNSGGITVTAGASGSNTITATLTAGPTASVSFSASGLPSGASPSFSAGSCSPTCSTTLTISTTASTPPGTYSITVTGSPLGRTTPFNLVVSGGSTGPPPIISPAPGSTLTSNTVTFTGGHTSADLQHFLYVGTILGGSNIIGIDLGTGHAATVSGLPNTGTIYVRYWTRFASGWQFRDQQYTMNVSGGTGPPPITSPAPGSTLTSSTVTFTGGHTAADLQHWLYVGTSLGASNLFSQDLGSGHSVTVFGLPSQTTIFVRYWTRFTGGWAFTDQTYLRP